MGTLVPFLNGIDVDQWARNTAMVQSARRKKGGSQLSDPTQLSTRVYNGLLKIPFTTISLSFL